MRSRNLKQSFDAASPPRRDELDRRFLSPPKQQEVDPGYKNKLLYSNAKKASDSKRNLKDQTFVVINKERTSHGLASVPSKDIKQEWNESSIDP